MRNVTSLKPKKTNEVFKHIPKFSEVCVPLDIAIMYMEDLYAGIDLPPTRSKSIVQRKLDRAYSKGEAPWRVVIG